MEVEVRMPFQVGDTLAVIGWRTADRAVNIIPFLQKEFSQERAVLSGDAGN